LGRDGAAVVLLLLPIFSLTSKRPVAVGVRFSGGCRVLFRGINCRLSRLFIATDFFRHRRIIGAEVPALADTTACGVSFEPRSCKIIRSVRFEIGRTYSIGAGSQPTLWTTSNR